MTRLDQIRARVAKLREGYDSHGLTNETDEEWLLARLDRARRALEKYGRHALNCEWEKSCQCGLESSRRGLEE